ncbi:hypothetical protein [Sphingobium agri]|uniref:Uncharacterized protein n=1 Tax=Sphingobium agri TaxID=2933566 RepID=A0ABT0DWM6_9SPHN|nr:hypothetical protein [Sphingobium agri]MCK0531449.1 hypothetical protein [Sphingobium agri]
MIAIFLAASIAQVGTFTVGETKDEMTDALQAGAFIENDQGRLSIFCNKEDGKNVRVMIDPIERIEGPGTIFTTLLYLRFDDGKPEIETWNDDADFMFIRQKKPVYKFASKLSKASRLRVRISGVGKDIDLDFPIIQAREALTYVSKKCDDPGLLRALQGSPG